MRYFDFNLSSLRLLEVIMKAVFSVWNNRIASVFDTASHVVLVEVESGCIMNESEGTLPDGSILEKILRLKDLSIGVVVCGAISREVQEQIVSYGIEVIPFVSGDLRRVIDGWLKGELDRDDFAMPGCCRGRGRRAGFCNGKFQMGTGGRKRRLHQSSRYNRGV